MSRKYIILTQVATYAPAGLRRELSRTIDKSGRRFGFVNRSTERSTELTPKSHAEVRTEPGEAIFSADRNLGYFIKSG